MKLVGIDALIIAAYMVVVIYIALCSRRFAGQNLENYWENNLNFESQVLLKDRAHPAFITQ